jgi:hypothetical protein
MDILSSILLWIGIIILFLAILSPFLYNRRFFDQEAGRESTKVSYLLLAIGFIFMLISIYIKGDTDLLTTIVCGSGLICFLLAAFILQLLISKTTGRYFPKLPRDEYPFPIDKLKNSIKEKLRSNRNHTPKE